MTTAAATPKVTAGARDDTATEPVETPFRWGRLVVAILALAFFLHLPAFFVDVFNSDETFIATQAEVIQQGGNLYEDAADRKPPMVPYVYAGTFEVLDTNALWSVRMVAAFAGALTAILLAVEARRRYGDRAAWIAGLLTVFALVAFAPQDGQAANFEIFMLPAMTAGVLLARRGRAASSGVAVAIATLAKQTGAVTMLPVLYLVWKRDRWRGLVRAGLGFGIPLALVAIAMGPRQLIYWTVLGNGSYVGVETASAYVVSLLLVMSIAWLACNLPIVWRLPVAWRDRRVPSRDGSTDTDLWLWAITAAIAVMVGLRFFGHYYLQLVPPLALLSAGALARGAPRLAKWTVIAAAVMALAFSAAGYFMQPFNRETHYERVAEYVQQHSDPDDSLLVWGNAPEIYWASGLQPATRFVATNSFLAGNHPGRPGEDAAPEESSPIVWDWFFEDLTANEPRFIVDTAPARIRGAEYSPITRFPSLQAFVEKNYRFVRTIDGIAVYEHR